MKNQLPEPEEIFFDDYPNFRPHFSPVTMLKLGVFGGTYMNDTEPSAKQCWANLRNSISEQSPFWADLNEALPSCSGFSKALNEDTYQTQNNFFGVKAGKDQKYWEDKGWIHPDDPRGWFEWYIKFYYGRRHEDDARQIKRWQDFITRHWGMLNYLCIKKELENNPTPPVHVLENPKENLIYDIGRYGPIYSPVTCQNLLQWGWNYTIKSNLNNKPKKC
jgi:hypothetical protein